MNINWNARLTNKTFWVSIIGAIVLLAQQCGLDISQFIPSNYVDIINTIFVILTIVGITVDTSTGGMSDKVVATVTEKTVQATNTEEKVQTTATTTKVNNTVDVNSASAKIEVDNPDNIQAIGATVNATSAVAPQ